MAKFLGDRPTGQPVPGNDDGYDPERLEACVVEGLTRVAGDGLALELLRPAPVVVKVLRAAR